MKDHETYDKEYRDQRLDSRRKITSTVGLDKPSSSINRTECPNCHRAIMVPYTQPPSGYFNKDGTERNSSEIFGFPTGSKWLKCPLQACNHRIPMSTKEQSGGNVQLAHAAGDGIGKLFIQTIGKKKKSETTTEDAELASYFGSTSGSITKVSRGVR